jgi:L-iditol 2-dehydrogenase
LVVSCIREQWTRKLLERDDPAKENAPRTRGTREVTLVKAMRFPEAGRAEIVEVSKPVPAAGEVLVRVRAAGICHSDVAAFQGTHNFRCPPVITGHELAGEVVQLGPKVRRIQQGARVAIEPHVGCGQCVYCRRGAYHECPGKRFVGVGDWIGAFAEYALATESMCHAMPEGMTYEEGATLEPFCVGLHAVRLARLQMGERVAILGVGAIGMMTLLAARLTAPGQIIASDPSAKKRELARRLGADLAIDPTTQDVLEAVRGATDGHGADIVFVCVARDDVLTQAVEATRRIGRLVIIASFFQGGPLMARAIQSRERTVIGSSMYTADDYQLAIRLWQKGLLPLSTLISERISLPQAPEAVAAFARSAKPDVVKTIIRFD